MESKCGPSGQIEQCRFRSLSLLRILFVCFILTAVFFHVIFFWVRKDLLIKSLWIVAYNNFFPWILWRYSTVWRRALMFSEFALFLVAINGHDLKGMTPPIGNPGTPPIIQKCSLILLTISWFRAAWIYFYFYLCTLTLCRECVLLSSVNGKGGVLKINLMIHFPTAWLTCCHLICSSATGVANSNWQEGQNQNLE